MTPRFILLSFGSVGLLGAGPVLGQSTPAPVVTTTGAVPPKRVLYYDVDGRLVAMADKAEHREELVYRDSIGGNLRIYYPSGNLRRLVPYLHFARGIKYGMETSFYETGEVKSRCPYKVEQAGPAEQFYRNGQVRSRQVLGVGADGSALTAQAFRPDGTPATDQDVHTEKMPSLKGSTGRGSSNVAIAEAVMHQLRYPMEAMRAQVTGRVLVSFMVDDAGFVRDTHIQLTSSPLLNAAALKAVASLGRFTPGELDGDTVEVSYTIPINFSIK